MSALKYAQWKLMDPMPAGKAQYGCILKDGDIYLIGGSIQDEASGGVAIYNTQAKTWRKGANMPTPRKSFGAVEHNGKIYCMGGRTLTDNRETAIVEIYDIPSNTWSQGVAMPSAIMNFGCAIAGTRIYCIGGYASGVRAYNNIFDLETGEWAGGEPIPQATDHFSAISLGPLIYCCGGRKVEQSNSSSGEIVAEMTIYNTITDEWYTETEAPRKLRDYGVCIINQYIFYIGGTRNNSVSNQCDVYNTQAKTWETISELNFIRYGLGAVSVGNKIYALGGSTTDNIRTMESLEIEIEEDEQPGKEKDCCKCCCKCTPKLYIELPVCGCNNDMIEAVSRALQGTGDCPGH